MNPKYSTFSMGLKKYIRLAEMDALCNEPPTQSQICSDWYNIDNGSLLQIFDFSESCLFIMVSIEGLLSLYNRLMSLFVLNCLCFCFITYIAGLMEFDYDLTSKDLFFAGYFFTKGQKAN